MRKINPRWCVSLEDVSQTAMTGEMASAPGTSGQDEQTSGRRRNKRSARKPSLRSQRVRNQRIRSFLQTDRQRALSCREPSKSARRRVLSLGGILQLSGGQYHLAETRAAAGFAEPFNVRYWGVGNELGAAEATSPHKSTRRSSGDSLHGSAIWRTLIIHRIRTERRRLVLDSGILRGNCPQGPCADPRRLGLGPPSLCLEFESRSHA